MKGDNVLREQRKEQYLTTNAEYAATIRKERISSWKEYCTMTSATNPWNELYKIAAGRRNQNAPTTTLRQKDRELTTNFHEILQYMMQKLTPEEDQYIEGAATQEIIDTTENKELPLQEVKNVVTSMRGKKRQGKMAYQAKYTMGWWKFYPTT